LPDRKGRYWKGRKGHFPRKRKTWILENTDKAFDINVGSEQNFSKIFEELAYKNTWQERRLLWAKPTPFPLFSYQSGFIEAW
jgi:hypothetical protein